MRRFNDLLAEFTEQLFRSGGNEFIPPFTIVAAGITIKSEQMFYMEDAVMKLEVTIGCIVCGFTDKMTVNANFDCSALICPKCKNKDCLSITSASEIAPENFKKENIHKRLHTIRQL